MHGVAKTSEKRVGQYTLRYIYNFFLRCFKIVMYLFHYFSRNPKNCSTELQRSKQPSFKHTALADWTYNHLP
jgi:hypothetical protein